LGASVFALFQQLLALRTLRHSGSLSHSISERPAAPGGVLPALNLVKLG
jgi:hypothetical protein